MAVVAFASHPERSEAQTLVEHSVTWLEERGHVARVVDGDHGALGQDADLLVSVGGDGTLLRAVSLAAGEGVPVLGVKIGRLGYLTQVEPGDLPGALERFVDGDYGIEERMALTVVATGPGGEEAKARLALNEAVIEKTVPGHTVRVASSIDERAFVTFAADALLVATPTGSTAYNLSARGPIVSPRLRALVMTPVSPHMLFDRPLVLDPSERVRLDVLEPRPAVLVLDGVSVATLEPGSSVTCAAADAPVRLVTFGGHDFHAILRAKFHLADR
ncbi:MAG: NAD(+)/NADH kinase [Actinomycetota bacterium]|nr:NAD(+)/NADH kinase [Actinomycetota bacterium]